jgi:hypothetical protein
VVSRAAVSCALASVIASLPAGRVSAAVVVLAHGLAEGLAPCRFGLRVEAAVLVAGVPIFLSAAEWTAAGDWLVLAVLPASGALSLPAPVAAVVSAGSGVELVERVGVGDGEGEVDVGSGDGDGDDVPGELLFELVGLEKRPFGLGVFLHPGDDAELPGWLDEGTADPEPSGPGCPEPTGVVGPEP